MGVLLCGCSPDAEERVAAGDDGDFVGEAPGGALEGMERRRGGETNGPTLSPATWAMGGMSLMWDVTCARREEAVLDILVEKRTGELEGELGRVGDWCCSSAVYVREVMCRCGPRLGVGKARAIGRGGECADVFSAACAVIGIHAMRRQPHPLPLRLLFSTSFTSIFLLPSSSAYSGSIHHI